MVDRREVADFIERPDGQRSPIDDLPTFTPLAIVDMIKSCWHFDHTERLSAMQCFGIVYRCRNIFADKVFDSFLSHRWIENALFVTCTNFWSAVDVAFDMMKTIWDTIWIIQGALVSREARWC